MERIEVSLKFKFLLSLASFLVLIMGIFVFALPPTALAEPDGNDGGDFIDCCFDYNAPGGWNNPIQTENNPPAGSIVIDDMWSPPGTTDWFETVKDNTGGTSGGSGGGSGGGGGGSASLSAGLTANPGTIFQGQSSTLSWQTVASGPNIQGLNCILYRPYPSGTAVTPTSGATSVAPSSTTTYELHCSMQYQSDNDEDGDPIYSWINAAPAVATVTVLPQTQCSDGVDNDGDGVIDHPNDPGCLNPADNDETDPPPAPQCSDGIDNSDPEDTLVDFPNDPGCASPFDDDETDSSAPIVRPQCSDGIDNEAVPDGLIDFGSDPQCASPSDDNEDFLPANLSIDATPKLVRTGSNSTIEWSADQVTSCVVTGPSGTFDGPDSIAPFEGSKDTAPITEESTFTLSCEDLGGVTQSSSVIVRPLPTFQEF